MVPTLTCYRYGLKIGQGIMEHIFVLEESYIFTNQVKTKPGL
jgi:hypothetical protein